MVKVRNIFLSILIAIILIVLIILGIFTSIPSVDLNDGWVSSPSIDEEKINSVSLVMQSGNVNQIPGYNSASSGERRISTSVNRFDERTYVTFNMQADGSVPELAQLSVYSKDGNKLNSDAYNLVCEKATSASLNNNSFKSAIDEWEEVPIDSIQEEGLYRVYATGIGSCFDTATSDITFEVVKPKPTGSFYSTYSSTGKSANRTALSNTMEYVGDVTYDAATNLKEGAPAYTVIVPSSDWRNQLLGMGFAGAGIDSGLMLTDFGADEDSTRDYNSQMLQAFLSAHSNSASLSYMIIGSSENVPQSDNTGSPVYLADYIENKRIQGGSNAGFMTRYGADSTSAQELATEAINTFKPENWGAEWGDIAVVASSNEEFKTTAAAEFIYLNAARVFFLKDDGTLAKEDIEILAGSDISEIVLVGDDSCVPDSVARIIHLCTGKVPSRILDEATTTDGTISLAKKLVGAEKCNWSAIVVADATESINVINAALLAASAGGVMLTCCTSADVKKVEAFLESLIFFTDISCVENIRTVGDFSFANMKNITGNDSNSNDNILDSLNNFLLSAWSVNYNELNKAGMVALENNDTFEVYGIIYEVIGESEVKIASSFGSLSAVNSSQRVFYSGRIYKVTGG